MTYSWSDEGTVIHRLRVRTSRLDPQAARLRAEFAFNTADLRPPGLPPAVVLYVRRLRDPCPGRLDLLHPGQPASPSWERAVQEALAELARGAARPAHEPVPAGAQAVLFADRAELIACLGRDWLDGCLYQHWWWRAALLDLDPARLVIRTCAEAPAFIPAALEQLASCGRAVEFVRLLGEPGAWQVLAAVLDFFTMPEVKVILEGLREHAPAAPLPTPAGSTPPWLPYVPEGRTASLGLVQQALLGIGLIQRRAPQAAHRPVFLEALCTWCEGFTAPPAGPEVLQTPHVPVGAPLERPVRALAARADGTPLPSPQAGMVHIEPGRVADRSTPENLPGRTDEMLASTLNQAPGLTKSMPATPPEQPQPQHGTTAGAELPARIDPVRREGPAPEPTAAWPEPAVVWLEPLVGTWFDTGFGGVFYLVNLGLFLGLYADFTRPLTPGIDLPLWDFLALLGRALVGSELEADPLWSWLARLGGRETDQAPGWDFLPPDSWRMPSDWLKPFEGPGAWTWSRRAGRLRLDHPASFRVVDVPTAAGEPSAQLGHEIRPYQGFVQRLKHGKPRPSEAEPQAAPPGLDAWLGWLLPYVRERLHFALGLEDSGNLGGLLCAHPARVYLTESHLDVTFSLAGLPIEIRRSGLDRDPGWVPAASRYVTFRYED